jgi:FAD/FMN-containing dehydrogenase
MNRREVLKQAAALPLFAGTWGPVVESSAPAIAAETAKNFRRVRPADSEWPSVADWQALKHQVGGRLIEVQPLLADCKTDKTSADCQQALKNLRNPYYVGDQPAGTMTVGWLNGWITAPSAYAVAAKNTDDVIAAVNFAREHKLRLVVKGGGHSYQGTSDSADSLLVWTRAMNSITMHDAFVAQGCDGTQAPQPAVTLGAGCVWMPVYDAVTTKAGRYVQGGGCATVGVAGLIQSGGFGSFSKNFGTAAGGLIEAEVVTADGQVRIANACTNSDLFWGIKGGGGGSLGVVTRLTLRTRDLPADFGGVHGTVKAASDAAFERLIGRFVSFYGENLLNPHWGEVVTFGKDGTLAITMVFQGLSQDEAGAVWKPFFDWVIASPQDFTVALPLAVHRTPARDWWNHEFLMENEPGRAFPDTRPTAPPSHIWFAEENSELGAFIHGFQSVWMPVSLLETDQQASLAKALFAASRYWAVALHSNKGLAGANAADVAAVKESAMNPAVLSAFALAIIAGADPDAYANLLSDPTNTSAARRNAEAIEKAADELRRVVPKAGSYVSESNYFDSNWQQSFWGQNYDRLRSIKDKYDPEGLFFVHHGVGSDDWSADGFTRAS